MQTNSRRVTVFAIILTVIIVIIGSAYLLLPRLLDLETYKEQILSQIQRSLNRPVTYSSGKFTFNLGPAFSFESVEIREPDNSGTFFSAKRVICRLALIPLLRKKIVISSLQAEGPDIHIIRTPDNRYNISDLLEKPATVAVPLEIEHIRVKDGAITFHDRFFQEEVITKLSDTDLSLEQLTRGSKSAFKLSAQLASGSFSVNGKIKVAPKESSILESAIDANVSTKHIEVGPFWPYYRQHVPFKKILGSVDMESGFHGRLKEFTTSGKITINSLHFDYQPVFSQPLKTGSITLKYDLGLGAKDINLKALEAVIDGLEVKGSCAIRNYRSNDPRITAQAITSRFNYDNYRQYVPYGIIVKDTAEWIKEHIAGGVYQLDEGRLDGLVSQILHMEKGENYNVLYIKGRVEKGLVSYGQRVPTFNGIKGVLEMKGKDFFLHGMSGRFGESPMTLEGAITDYPLDKPSGYPFRMTIGPGKNEITWLLGSKKGKDLNYNGNSYMTLKGEGYTSGYNLSGEWDLTPSAYSYSNYVKKPVGTPSSISFKGSISPKEAALSSLHYTLGGLSINMSAMYPFSSSKTLDLVLNTNSFSMEGIAGFSPLLSSYQPAGLVQLSVRGTSKDPDMEEFGWQGTLSLTNATFRYSQTEKPVSAITGKVSFAEKAMESSQLTARIGSTVFTGKGAIESLNPLAFNTVFSSQKVDLADFGLAKEKKSPRITKVNGEVSYKDNKLAVKTISGFLNNSQLTIKGSVTDLDSPKAYLSVASSYLDIADLALLSALEKDGAKPAKNSSPPSLAAAIKAETGTFLGANFEKLTASISMDSKNLQVRSLYAETMKGNITTKGTIIFLNSSAGYQFNFKLSDAATDEVLQLFSVAKREITGTAEIEGEIAAKGTTADEIKKSLSGKIRIDSNKGTLRRFPILSKIFSILNVSQLFKLKLPDMVSEGMPYNDIKGTLMLKNGSISSKDLFVASNAMNISMIGGYDYVNDNLDCTVGLQPLQTVDKVVSKIPIVGWILTGKEKSLISTYFEVKGKSSSPNVSAIPVKSLGKGVLGIFQRLFQLPGKLVTDTGEVILGN
jgi:uncharacterized protein YhdP